LNADLQLLLCSGPAFSLVLAAVCHHLQLQGMVERLLHWCRVGGLWLCLLGRSGRCDFKSENNNKNSWSWATQRQLKERFGASFSEDHEDWEECGGCQREG